MKYFKLILTNNFISRWNKFLRFKSINFGTRFKKRVRFPTILQVFLISQRITRNRIVFSREFIKKQIIYQEKTRKSPRINDHFQGHARPSIFHPPSWIKIPKFRPNRARISAGISQWGRQRERKSGHRVARLSSRGGRVIDSNPPSKLSSRPSNRSPTPCHTAPHPWRCSLPVISDSPTVRLSPLRIAQRHWRIIVLWNGYRAGILGFRSNQRNALSLPPLVPPDTIFPRLLLGR